MMHFIKGSLKTNKGEKATNSKKVFYSTDLFPIVVIIVVFVKQVPQIHCVHIFIILVWFRKGAACHPTYGYSQYCKCYLSQIHLVLNWFEMFLLWNPPQNRGRVIFFNKKAGDKSWPKGGLRSAWLHINLVKQQPV